MYTYTHIKHTFFSNTLNLKLYMHTCIRQVNVLEVKHFYSHREVSFFFSLSCNKVSISYTLTTTHSLAFVFLHICNTSILLFIPTLRGGNSCVSRDFQTTLELYFKTFAPLVPRTVLLTRCKNLAHPHIKNTMDLNLESA